MAPPIYKTYFSVEEAEESEESPCKMLKPKLHKLQPRMTDKKRKNAHSNVPNSRKHPYLSSNNRSTSIREEFLTNITKPTMTSTLKRSSALDVKCQTHSLEDLADMATASGDDRPESAIFF